MENKKCEENGVYLFVLLIVNFNEILASFFSPFPEFACTS